LSNGTTGIQLGLKQQECVRLVFELPNLIVTKAESIELNEELEKMLGSHSGLLYREESWII
jgi:hypothetical protein